MTLNRISTSLTTILFSTIWNLLENRYVKSEFFVKSRVFCRLPRKYSLLLEICSFLDKFSFDSAVVLFCKNDITTLLSCHVKIKHFYCCYRQEVTRQQLTAGSQLQSDWFGSSDHRSHQRRRDGGRFTRCLVANPAKRGRYLLADGLINNFYTVL